MNNEQTINDRFLGIGEITSLAGFSQTHIYRLIKKGEFPKGHIIGGSRRWRETAIKEWMDSVAPPGDAA